jgi:hypothetical protein
MPASPGVRASASSCAGAPTRAQGKSVGSVHRLRRAPRLHSLCPFPAHPRQAIKLRDPRRSPVPARTSHNGSRMSSGQGRLRHRQPHGSGGSGWRETPSWRASTSHGLRAGASAACGGAVSRMNRSKAATTAAASSGEASGATIWSLGRRLTMGSGYRRSWWAGPLPRGGYFRACASGPAGALSRASSAR